MIRYSAIAALLVLLAGCGGGGDSSDSTDPSKLATLSEADRAEMIRHDAEVADAEKAQLLVTPEVKEKRSKKKADTTSATAERF